MLCVFNVCFPIAKAAFFMGFFFSPKSTISRLKRTKEIRVTAAVKATALDGPTHNPDVVRATGTSPTVKQKSSYKIAIFAVALFQASTLASGFYFSFFFAKAQNFGLVPPLRVEGRLRI